MHEILSVLLKYNGIVLMGAAVFTFFVTQFLKLPIKKWTSKIKNEDTRKMVNATILLLPFVFGCLYEFLYARFYLNEAFDLCRGLQFGMSGISAYAVVERFLKKKVKVENTETVQPNKTVASTDTANTYDVGLGKEFVQVVEEVTADGKIDEKDISAVEKFLNRHFK